MVCYNGYMIDMTFYRHETARRLNHLLSAGHDLHIHGKRYAPKSVFTERNLLLRINVGVTLIIRSVPRRARPKQLLQAWHPTLRV